MVMYLGLLVVVLVVMVMMRIARNANGTFTVIKDADHDGVPDVFKSVSAGRSGFTPKLGPGEVSPADPAMRLKQLQDMRSSGLITNDEYEAKRTQILDKL